MRFLIFIKVLCAFFFAYFVASAQETRMVYSDLIPNDFQKFDNICVQFKPFID